MYTTVYRRSVRRLTRELIAAAIKMMAVSVREGLMGQVYVFCEFGYWIRGEMGSMFSLLEFW